METSEKIYQLALYLIKGIGFRHWHYLSQHFGSAQALFELPGSAFYAVSSQFPRNLVAPIIEKDTVALAEKVLADHEKGNIQVISFFEENYPERLRHISDPPAFLYYKGTASLNGPRMVSIVGTRQATAYGRQAVTHVIEGLRRYNPFIVSGLAYGIDIQAHTVALAQEMPTMAVLASGLDIIYPAVHKRIADSMLDQGGWVSEVPFGTKLENFQFTRRNRIIAGLSDATLVVEANIKSGALITAYRANEYNREVFAIPGPIGQASSLGCNHLIKTQQAHLIADANDIAYIMNWDNQAALDYPLKAQAAMANLTKEEAFLLEILKKCNKEVGMDELCTYADYPATSVSAIVFQLHLKNIVEVLPGNKVKLGAG